MFGNWRIYARFQLDRLLHRRWDSVALEYDSTLRQWKKSIATAPSQSYSASYFGKLKHDKPTGYGMLVITPPSYGYVTVYLGGWKEGRFHGKGTLKTDHSSHSHKYTGHFRDGLKHGYGKESTLGWEYRGRYENDAMCGTPIEN